MFSKAIDNLNGSARYFPEFKNEFHLCIDGYLKVETPISNQIPDFASESYI